jgi:hypothetical protein
MSGIRLIVLTICAILNIVLPHARSAIPPQSLPYVLALLMAAAVLALACTLARCQTTDRSGARGAKLRKVRRLGGPRDRRA